MQTIIKFTERLELTRDGLLKIIREKIPAAREVRYLSNIEPAAAGDKSLAVVYDGKIEADIKEILKNFIKKDEENMSKILSAIQSPAITPVEAVAVPVEVLAAPVPAAPVPAAPIPAALDVTSLAAPDVMAWLGANLPWVRNVLGIIKQLWDKVAAVVKSLDDLKDEIEQDSTSFESEQEKKRLQAAKELDERINKTNTDLAASLATINTSLTAINVSQVALAVRVAAQDTKINAILEDLDVLRPEIASGKSYRAAMAEGMKKVQADAEAKAEAAKKAKMAEMEAAKIVTKKG